MAEWLTGSSGTTLFKLFKIIIAHYIRNLQKQDGQNKQTNPSQVHLDRLQGTPTAILQLWLQELNESRGLDFSASLSAGRQATPAEGRALFPDEGAQIL